MECCCFAVLLSCGAAVLQLLTTNATAALFSLSFFQSAIANPQSALHYVECRAALNPMWFRAQSPYLPFHRGVRLFRKAEIPSRASSVRALRAIISLA
jgi:hypothetical protein